MKQTIWTQTYAVNTIVLDHNKRLGLVGLLNLLQDAAWVHATHLGWGYHDLIEQGTIWALVRQKVVMSDWPQWGETAVVRTWPRGTAGALALREFDISVGERRLGEGTTSWLILDAATRRPRKLDRGRFDQMARTEGLLKIEAGKIALRTDLKPAATFEVRNSDLDVNGHVNNTRYAQWILDSLPADDLAQGRIEEYEVNFLAETGVGDTVVIERGEPEPADGARTRCQFQGRRTADGKTVFAATLSVVPRA